MKKNFFAILIAIIFVNSFEYPEKCHDDSIEVKQKAMGNGKDELIHNESEEKFVVIKRVKSMNPGQVDCLIDILTDFLDSLSPNQYYPTSLLGLVRGITTGIIEFLSNHKIGFRCVVRSYVKVSAFNENYLCYQAYIFYMLRWILWGEHLIFLQFYLCSPHVNKFVVEQTRKHENSAMKMLKTFLFLEIDSSKDKIDSNNIIISFLSDFLFDLACDDNIKCNIVRKDVIRDQSYVDLLNLTCFKTEDLDKNPISPADLYHSSIIPFHFFDYDKDTNRLNFSEKRMSMYENFPSTILIHLCCEKLKSFETSILFIDSKKYSPHASYNFNEYEEENCIILKTKSGWRLLNGTQEDVFVFSASHIIPIYLMYTLDE